MLQLLFISDGNMQSMLSHWTNKDHAPVVVQLSVFPTPEHFFYFANSNRAAAVVQLSKQHA